MDVRRYPLGSETGVDFRSASHELHDTELTFLTARHTSAAYSRPTATCRCRCRSGPTPPASLRLEEAAVPDPQHLVKMLSYGGSGPMARCVRGDSVLVKWMRSIRCSRASRGSGRRRRLAHEEPVSGRRIPSRTPRGR